MGTESPCHACRTSVSPASFAATRRTDSSVTAAAISASGTQRRRPPRARREQGAPRAEEHPQVEVLVRRLRAVRRDGMHIEIEEHAGARAARPRPDRPPPLATSSRATSPASSRTSRRAAAATEASPASRCPPGWSQRPSRRWKMRRSAAASGERTKALAVKCPGA